MPSVAVDPRASKGTAQRLDERLLHAWSVQTFPSLVVHTYQMHSSVEQAIYWYTWCARPLPVHGFVEIPNVSLVEYKPLADWRCDICKAHTTGK